jgi:hypothetical protein
MANDGKGLEGLVRYIETELLPPGFVVTANQKVCDDEGRIIAELDLDIRGKVGSTDFAWLIECRDRPGQGSAPASWIEQLVGRRQRFGFHKVTAVSTTGFSSGAERFARQSGIEIREVRELSPEHFNAWLHFQAIERIERRTTVQSCMVRIDPSTAPALRACLDQMFTGIDSNEAFLLTAASGHSVAPKDAFHEAVSSAGSLFNDVPPNGSPKRVRIRSVYPEGHHYIVPTPLGDIPIHEIDFEGDLSIHVTQLPLLQTAEYRGAGDETSIAQVASFAACAMGEDHFRIELHRFSESGVTHVTLRKVAGSD